MLLPHGHSGSIDGAVDSTERAWLLGCRIRENEAVCSPAVCHRLTSDKVRQRDEVIPKLCSMAGRKLSLASRVIVFAVLWGVCLFESVVDLQQRVSAEYSSDRRFGSLLSETRASEKHVLLHVFQNVLF